MNFYMANEFDTNSYVDFAPTKKLRTLAGFVGMSPEAVALAADISEERASTIMSPDQEESQGRLPDKESILLSTLGVVLRMAEYHSERMSSLWNDEPGEPGRAPWEKLDMSIGEYVTRNGVRGAREVNDYLRGAG